MSDSIEAAIKASNGSCRCKLFSDWHWVNAADGEINVQYQLTLATVTASPQILPPIVCFSPASRDESVSTSPEYTPIPIDKALMKMRRFSNLGTAFNGLISSEMAAQPVVRSVSARETRPTWRTESPLSPGCLSHWAH
jgi:hypothetical protein